MKATKEAKELTETQKKNVTVAKFIEQRLNKVDRSQSEIASIMGYANPNMITMFKQGRTKVPLSKIPQLAQALDVDPLHLLRVVMGEYSPETWTVLDSLIGESIVTKSEMEVIKMMREVGKEWEVSPKNDEQKRKFMDLVADWAKESSAKTIKH